MRFGEKMSCILYILKAWDPFINHMVTILKYQINIIVEYIMINTLRGEWAPLTQDKLLSGKKCDISTHF